MGEADAPRLRQILTRASAPPGRGDGSAEELAACLRLGTETARAAPARADGREIVVAGWRQDPWAPDLFEAAALMIGLTHGMLTAHRHEVRREVEGRLESWARWVHDGAAQSVVAAVVQLENLRETVVRDPENAVGVIDEIQVDLRRSSEELRGLLSRLAGQRPFGDDRDRSMVREVDEASRRWNLSVATTIEGDVTRVPPPIEDAAADVVREALTNTGKHAEVDEATVRFLVSPHRLLVVVSDEGRGFHPDREGRDAGLGLAFATRRAAQVEGTVRVTSRPGEGTEVWASFPLPPDDQVHATRQAGT